MFSVCLILLEGWQKSCLTAHKLQCCISDKAAVPQLEQQQKSGCLTADSQPALGVVLSRSVVLQQHKKRS